MNRWFDRRPIDMDWALLILRLGVGLSMMLLHGYGKIRGGPELWTGIGRSMGSLGIAFFPTMWGFLAAFAEFFGSLLVALGIFTRPAAAMLAFTMLVAALHHLGLPADEPRSGWSGASHAIELGVVFVAIFLAGPGRFAIGRR